MEGLKLINSGLRFFLEIAALFIFSYWGFSIVNHVLLRIILGLGTPLVAAVIWGAFGSPKAPYALTGFSKRLLEVGIFGLSALALFGTGKHVFSILYGLIAFINLLLLKVWKQ